MVHFYLWTVLFFSFNCLGIETPGELQGADPTEVEKAITTIGNLPDEIGGVRKEDLEKILDQSVLIEYFKNVGEGNFSGFIKRSGGKKVQIERYIKLFGGKDKFEAFVTEQKEFKDFIQLSKSPEFNEKFQTFTRKTFDQALKNDPVPVSE